MSKDVSPFCRGCLSTNSRLIHLSSDQTSLFFDLVGIRVDYSSPTYLCYICLRFFSKYRRYRERCRRVQYLLEEAAFTRHKITNTYINSIDRNSHNLTLNLTTTQISDINDLIVVDEDLIKLEEIEETKHEIEPVFIKEAESSAEEYSPDSDSDFSVDEKLLKTHYKLKNNKLIEYKTFFDSDAFEKSYNMTVTILSKEEQIKEIAQRKETSKSAHKCNECGKEFKSDLNLNAHFKSFHIPSIGDYVCEICKVRYSVKNKLFTHLDNHKYVFKCKQCDFVCRAKSTAKTHHAWHKGQIYTCPYCDKIFEKITTRLSHVRFNHASELKFCQFCGESFIGKVGLNGHKKRVHKDITLSQQCSSCSVKFASEQALLTHTSYESCGKNSCVVCGDSFDSVEFLRNHLVQAHRPQKLMDLKCERCGDSFESSKALINHMKAESCKGGCSCAVCGDTFESEELLRSHDVEHENDKRFKCKECNRSFASSDNYNDHYDRIHSGVKRKRAPRRAGAGGERGGGKRKKPEGEEERLVKKAVCEICGKGFKNGALLRYHQRVHTGEKPYPCPECPKRFSMPLLLQLHLRVHTGERPYQCEYCPKAFKSKTAVNRHILIHTGERRHVCHMCNKTFITSSDMKSHVQAVHLRAPRQAQRVRTKREPVSRSAQ